MRNKNTKVLCIFMILNLLLLIGCGNAGTLRPMQDVQASSVSPPREDRDVIYKTEETSERETGAISEESKTIPEESETASESERYLAEIPGLPLTGRQLSDFVPVGWELLDSVELDFNQDGRKDHVGVLEQPETEEGEYPDNSLRILFAIESQKEGYRLSFQDANLIRTRMEGGVYGDPYLPLTAEDISFTTHSYGGSAWRWDESFTYAYKEGVWYLTGSEYSSGYGVYITSHHLDNWETGVGIREERSSEFDDMEEHWEEGLPEYDLVYELTLDEPMSLSQAGMRWWMATQRRTDWETASVHFADGIDLLEDRIEYPGQMMYYGYNDEERVLYTFLEENSGLYYLAMYCFYDQSLWILEESERNMGDVAFYKGKVYYTTEIEEEVSYKAKDGESIEETDTVGMLLNRMNGDGTQKEKIFEYRYPQTEQESHNSGIPYMGLIYEISGDEIVVEVYLGDGHAHPFYRMNTDGSSLRQIGQVPDSP